MTKVRVESFSISNFDSARYVVSLLLAAATCLLFFNGGSGAVGGWLLGCIVSTVVLAFVGGRRRVLFTAIAVAPPFMVITAYNLYYSTIDPSAGLPPYEMLFSSTLAFGVFVALPILVAIITTRITK